jgi:hypothetical protein
LKSTTDEKLQSHPTGLLAWAIAGNVSIGDPLTDWVKTCEWPPANSETFVDQVSAKVAELNGHQREMLKLANVQEKDQDTAIVLLVLCLDTLQVVVIDDRGAATRYRRDEFPFHAIGSDGPHAKLIDAAYRYVGANIPDVPRMNIVMSLASTKEPNCSLPIHIWRVSKQGIAKDLSAELQPPSPPQQRSPI